MRYRQAINYLNNKERSQGVKLGLQRIKALLKKLGDPHKKIPVIHIAGTNGKGSVSIMMTNALLASGYKVGTYLSPHFVRYNERFLINGQEISNKEFENIFTMVLQEAAQIEDITEFEILTAIAFLYFSKAELDVVVMETGLGGRYDATNVARSILTIITPIAFDHEKILGSSIKEIAQEKAGIIKKGIPVVVADQDESAMQIIMDTVEYFENECRVVCSPLKQELKIMGEYQGYNAALVYEGVMMLRKFQIYIPDSFLLDGIMKTEIPGRTHLVSSEPVTIVDVAHNPHGIKNLVATIEKNYPYHKKVYILGMLKRKDALKAVNIVKKSADTLITVGVNNKEAYSADDLLKIAASQGVPNVIKKRNVAAAYKFARKKQKDKIIVIAGSFYLAGEFYKKFF